jgi:polyhydroxyalkanoate synthesis regulator phasin
MSVVMESSELKSPVRKLVQFFRRSRDNWKQKHHAMKRKCRRLAYQAAVVEKSREQWRTQVQDLRQRVHELETELAKQKASRLTKL